MWATTAIKGNEGSAILSQYVFSRIGSLVSRIKVCAQRWGMDNTLLLNCCIATLFVDNCESVCTAVEEGVVINTLSNDK